MFSNFRALASLPYMRHGFSRSCRLYCMKNVQYRQKFQEKVSISSFSGTRSERASSFLNVVRVPDKGACHLQACRQQHTSPADVNSIQITQEIKQPSVEKHASYLTLDHPSLPHPLKLNYFWLRDNCRCAECYNEITNLRSVDILEIPENIQPLECTVEGDVLHINWFDHHHTTYSVSWLMENMYEIQKVAPEKVEKVTWDADKFKSLQLPSITFQRLLEDDNVLRDLIWSILAYGVAKVHEVPATKEGTQQIAIRIGPIMNTYLGSAFKIKYGDTEFQDIAYTSEAVGPHTDLTSYSEPSGVLLFHLLSPSSTGGKTLMVDGFHVAQQFQKTNPEGYKMLAQTPIGEEFISLKKYQRHFDTFFKHHPVTKELIQVRCNPPYRSPLSSVPIEELDMFYKSLQGVMREMRRPENGVWLHMDPNTVLLLDNWRVFHGRSAFTGSRLLSVCYIRRSDFLSTARVMELLSNKF